jgi:hypothetical protein
MLAACFLIAICLQCQTQPASKLVSKLPFTVRKASAASAAAGTNHRFPLLGFNVAVHFTEEYSGKNTEIKILILTNCEVRFQIVKS